MPLYRIEPMSAPRMNDSDRYQKRPVVVEYFKWRSQINRLGVTIPQPCKIVFHLAMPQSWPEKKKVEFCGKPAAESPKDIDNMLKAILDAVFSQQYGEKLRDNHIWNVWAVKLWAREGGIQIDAMNAG